MLRVIIMQPCTALIKILKKFSLKFITSLFQYAAGHVQLQQWPVLAAPLMQNLDRNVQYNVYHYPTNPMLTLCYLFQSVIMHNIKSGMYTNFT